MTTQPEALRLADALDTTADFQMRAREAAIELRRLHEVNQELLEALKDVMYWDNGKPEWDVARAAIAKAKGESK